MKPLYEGTKVNHKNVSTPKQLTERTIKHVVLISSVVENSSYLPEGIPLQDKKTKTRVIKRGERYYSKELRRYMYR